MKTTHQTNSQNNKARALFVTGTDTDVGKTHICGLLLDYLLRQGHNAGYQKWASTGGESPEDLKNCLASCEKKPTSVSVDLHVPFRYTHPVSPHLAAELENRPPIDINSIKKSFETISETYDFLLVEGVGGILVPLRRDLFLADLVAEMDLQVLIVARSGLGTINHTLLTLEAARQRNIDTLGVVFTDSHESEDEVIVKDNLQTIGEMGRTKIFGRLPWHSDIATGREAFKPIGEKILSAINNANQ